MESKGSYLCERARGHYEKYFKLIFATLSAIFAAIYFIINATRNYIREIGAPRIYIAYQIAKLLLNYKVEIVPGTLRKFHRIQIATKFFDQIEYSSTLNPNFGMNSNNRIHSRNLDSSESPSPYQPSQVSFHDHYSEHPNHNDKPNPEEPEYLYLTKNISTIARFFSLQYFIVLKQYWHDINFETLIRYRPQFRKMIDSEYMWFRFLVKGDNFSLFKEIFKAEKGPFIFIWIFSFLIGVITLFGAYYQRFLFRQHHDHDFHTSGWVFFGVIVGAALIRFFIFNYLQTTANEVAINTRIHLQNSYIRAILKLPKSMTVDEKALLYFNYFASIEVIYLALKLMPYFISSVVIVFGIIGFIVDIVGSLGYVLLGFTGFAFFVEILLLFYMHHLHEHYAEVSDRRNSLSVFGSSFLMRLIYSGLSLSFLKRILRYRRQETNIDIKYTIADGFIAIFAETAAFLTVFIFFVHEQRTGEPSYAQIFESVVLFSVFKTPVKMMAYGLAFTMEYLGSIHALQTMFDLCEWREPIVEEKTFARVYSQPTTLWQRQQFWKTSRTEGAEIVLQKSHLLTPYKGQLVMILGRLNAHPTCEQKLQQIIQSFPPELKYAYIEYDPFILDASIKENILFGEPYDKNKFEEVLEIVHLKDRVGTFSKLEHTRMDENYFKTMYLNLSFKIELARALYNEIDVLMVNRQIFRDYERVLRSIKEYRNRRGQITVVVNLSGSHYQLADTLMVLRRHKEMEIGTYDQLKGKSHTLTAFEAQFHNHYKNVTKEEANPIEIRSAPFQFEYFEDVNTSYKNIFRFYNSNHCCAGVLLLGLLVFPPLVDLYMEVIVGESKDFFDSEHSSSHSAYVGAEAVAEEEQKITRRYGFSLLIFAVASIIKVVVLSAYLRNAAYSIFKELMTKFMNTKIETTLAMANKKNALDLERNTESMDIRTTTELDIGLTIFFELLAIMVFATVSSRLFLGVAIPFSIIAGLIFAVMVKYSRKIFAFRRKSRGRINGFVKKLINHRTQIEGYSKNDFIFQQYASLNHEEITYELNEDWLLEALTIILELVVILMLAVALAISISLFEELEQSHEAFLELSISFLIGLVNGARLDLKLFKQIDRQVIGISSLYKMIEHHDTHKMHVLKDFPNETVQRITFDKFSVEFRDDILTDLSLVIKKGERVVVTGSRLGGKRVAFYSLFRMFQHDHISGVLKINDCEIYNEKISRESLERLVHVVENRPLTVFGYTVKSNIINVVPEATEEEVVENLNKIWKILEIEPLFDVDSVLTSLSIAYMDVVSLLLAIMVKPQILIIEGGFSHTDTINREKITKWLIHESDINIILDLTNRIEVIDLYPRHLHFEEGKLKGDKLKAIK